MSFPYPASCLDPRGSLVQDLGIVLEGLMKKGQGVMAAWCYRQATVPAPGAAPWPFWHPLLTPAALNSVHFHWCLCHLGTSGIATQSLVDWDLSVGDTVNTHTEGQRAGLVLRPPERQML